MKFWLVGVNDPLKSLKNIYISYTIPCDNRFLIPSIRNNNGSLSYLLEVRS